MSFKKNLNKSIEHLSTILLERGLNVNLIDFTKFQELVLFIFKLDDAFDKNLSESTQSKTILINQLKTKLVNYKQTLRELDKHIDYRNKESNQEEIRTPNEYLTVTGVTIGTHLFAAFLVDTFKLNSSLWMSDQIQKYQTETNQILRLSNDLLDFSEDKLRLKNEKHQTKISSFIKSSFQIKLLILLKYLKHKAKYFFYRLFNKNTDLKAIIIVIESVFDWGYYEMYLNKNSGRN